jgi:alpha-galactosidase
MDSRGIDNPDVSDAIGPGRHDQKVCPGIYPIPINHGVVMKFYILCVFCWFFFSLSVQSQVLWLDELDLSAMDAGWGTPNTNLSVEGNPLKIAGRTFTRGVGTHAVSTILLHLDEKGKRFRASVGVDDEVGTGPASVEFFLLGDKAVLWHSGVMKKNDSARTVDVNIEHIKLLGLLVTDAGDGIDYDHADWCDAKIDLTEMVPGKNLTAAANRTPYILTPPSPETPEIHGAKIFGVRSGNPFLYTIAASGKRPMAFSADNLPDGLTLDPVSGKITGSLRKEGEYVVTFHAKNETGGTTREFRIVAGKTICLTPPMGWNSWNCWAEAVDDAKVRAAADAMVSSGLIQHGWTYINIDDCWMIKPNSTDSLTTGEARDPNGRINSNRKFPDMKALSDYVHQNGLKLGIYSSPGPLTCAGYTACYGYEIQDAARFGEWGIDYLKYDWCSYDKIAKNKELIELEKPYFVMRDALDHVSRDIVYSLCQYGMGNVWEWGTDVGGNCWRTTGDITDAWSSMAGIGFKQAGHARYAKPGHWNDPDMLVVGNVGWGPSLHPTRLSPDEQYTHISLWSLLAAPLLIGCDLSHLDDFTKNLLTNDEVIDINQDPLGKQAIRVSNTGGVQIWVKDLEDGSKAVGLFNVGLTEVKLPEDYFDWEKKATRNVTLRSSDLGWKGKFNVRDVWRQKYLGIYDNSFSGEVPRHGVLLVRIQRVSD